MSSWPRNPDGSPQVSKITLGPSPVRFFAAYLWTLPDLLYPLKAEREVLVSLYGLPIQR